MPRRLLYVVPTVAALVAGVALVGPGKARGVDAARVLGAVDADGRIRSLRVVAAHREEQRDTPLGGEVRVESTGLVSTATLGPNGVGEVTLDRALSLGDALVITRAGRVILQGRLSDSGSGSDDLVVAVNGFGKHEGTLRVSPHLVRGPLVPPFGDSVFIDVTDSQGKAVEGKLDVHFDGATCADCSTESPATIAHAVVPVADQVAVDATVRASDGRQGSFSGKLPTAMGSFWFAPLSADSALHLVAATPKEWAYVSLFDESGRIGGRVVAVTERSDGFYEGTLERTPNELAAGYVVVASDEGESGRTTSAWSLRGETSRGEPKTLRRLAKLLDGFPDATRRESERLRRVHFILAGFVAALAFIEIALLGALARGTRRDLTEHFKSSVDLDDEAAAPSAIQPVRSTLIVVSVVALLIALSAAALVALTLVTR